MGDYSITCKRCFAVCAEKKLNLLVDQNKTLASRLEYLNRTILDFVKDWKAKPAEKATEPTPVEAAEMTPEPELKPVTPVPSESVVEASSQGPDEDRPGVFERSRRLKTARDILRGIWRWIIFGDENKRAGVNTEVALATTWLVRIGVLVLVTGAIYFLQWSLERDLIPPAIRVGASLMAGVGLVVSGIRLLGKKYHLMGQGLLGGGFLILYAASFASGPVYSLFGQASIIAAFVLMILVTISAGVVSVKTDSLLIAILGLAGGFITPVMLKTDTPDLPVFFSYILLLSLGIMAIAFFKQWFLLNYLGFACTYIMFFAALATVYEESDFVLSISFAVAFLVVHSFIVYINNLIRGNRSTSLEIIHLVANALCFAGAAYWLVESKYGRPYPAVMSLSLAVFYIIHVLVFFKKQLTDRPLLIALTALAGLFTAWTLPLVLEKESLTIGLSLLAFMFLWIARKLDSNFIENLAHGLYLVVFFRLLWLDLPRHFNVPYKDGESIALYWRHLSARLVNFGIAIASVVGGFFVQKARATTAGVVSTENNTPRITGIATASGVFYWCSVFLIFLFAHLELGRMFMYFRPLRLPILTVVWCLLGVYLLVKYLADGARDKMVLCVMTLALGAAAIKVFVTDIVSWDFGYGLIYDMEYGILHAGARLLDFGVLIAAFFAVWLLVGVKRNKRDIANMFGYGSLFLLFVYMSLELNSLLFWKLAKFQRGGLSILWALFAMGFVSGGIWKNIAPLRYIGLGLFAVVAGKVFFVDLSGMEMLYRVIAFVVVGVILLLGAFAYLYSGKSFSGDGRQ